MAAVVAVVAGIAGQISLANILLSVALNLVLGFIKQKLFPQQQPLGDKARRISVLLRSAVADHRIIYGRVISSGTLVFGHISPSSNLHLVMVLAGHEVDAIEDVYLNDKITTHDDFGGANKQQEKWTATNKNDANIGLTINSVTFEVPMVSSGLGGGTDAAMSDLYDEITGAAGYAAENYTVVFAETVTQVSPFSVTTITRNGTLVFTAKTAGTGFTVANYSGTWNQQVINENKTARFADVTKHLGTPTQAADAALVAVTSKWTTSHRLRGLAYLYLDLFGNLKAYPTGMPNIKCITRGRKVMDPRDTPLTVVGATAADPTVIEITAHGLSVGQSVFIVGTNQAALNGELFVTATPDADHVRGISIRTPGDVANNYELALATAAGAGNAYIMRWSDNWALCVLDYLMGFHGLKAALDEVDMASFIAAANISDEQVPLTVTEVTVTADSTTDIFTISSGSIGARTGDIVQLASTGTLPGNISAATNYYLFDTGYNKNNRRQFSLATTLANARAKTAINISSNGTGTITLELHSQLRYTCNGLIETGNDPADLLRDLLTAGAGFIVYTQGQFRIFAGAYTAPAWAFDTNDLRADVDVQAKLPRRDLYNVVRGIFINPDAQWQATDFPPLRNAAYTAQDGEEIVYDISLPFTNESVHGQRIAKILLEKSRNQIAMKAPCNLAAFKAAVGDVVEWTIADFSWTDKEFRVMEWELSEDGGVDVVLQEEDSTIYSWSEADATNQEPPPDVEFPDPSAVPPITGLAAASGTAELLDTGDGNVLSRIKLTWDAVTDNNVLEGGHIVVSYKLSAAPPASWVDATILPDKTEYYLSPVQDGFMYDIRVKPFNVFGVSPDDFTYLFNHEVIGKTAPPPDVTGFSVAQNGDVVVFKWNKVNATDLAGYEIRYAAQGDYVWADAIKLTEITKGTQITTAAVPPGALTFGIKAVDTSGNKSVNDATRNLTVTNTFDVIVQRDEAPRWLGTLTNMGKHHTNVIYCHSQGVAADDGWDTFDEYVPDPEASCSYESDELDIGFDDLVRVYAEHALGVNPMVAEYLDPSLQIDYKLAAGSYDGFEVWTIGNVSMRYLKGKLVFDTSEGVPYITGFTPIADVQEHTEVRDGLDVNAAGETINFLEEFHFIPHMNVSVESATALIATYDNLTVTSFDAHVFDTDGAEVGITGGYSYTATGA